MCAWSEHVASMCGRCPTRGYRGSHAAKRLAATYTDAGICHMGAGLVTARCMLPSHIMCPSDTQVPGTSARSHGTKQSMQLTQWLHATDSVVVSVPSCGKGRIESGILQPACIFKQSSCACGAKALFPNFAASNGQGTALAYAVLAWALMSRRVSRPCTCQQCPAPKPPVACLLSTRLL